MTGSQHAIWIFPSILRRGCWRGLGLAGWSRESQDTMCVSVLVAEIRAGTCRTRTIKGEVKRKESTSFEIHFVYSVDEDNIGIKPPKI